MLERTPDLDQSVEVPATAIGQHGAGIGLRPGDQITYRALLLGLMVKSATDCAVTLATAVAGDEPSFVVLMNARAGELGLEDTHFVNCTGLNVPGHYSSARDLSELGRVAMRDPQFRALAKRVWARITWSPSRENFVVSRNRLNARYDWVDGIKTGSTEGTGACMVASGRYGGRRLIVTTLHEPNRDQEVKDALGLFAFGASRFSRSVVVRRGQRVGEVTLLSGGKAALVAEDDLSRVVRKGAHVGRGSRRRPRSPRPPTRSSATHASRPTACCWAACRCARRRPDQASRGRRRAERCGTPAPAGLSPPHQRAEAPRGDGASARVLGEPLSWGVHRLLRGVTLRCPVHVVSA